jgi:hypothetical protein
MGVGTHVHEPLGEKCRMRFRKFNKAAVHPFAIEERHAGDHAKGQLEVDGPADRESPLGNERVERGLR